MTSQTRIDTQISAYLADGPTEFPAEWREVIAAAAEQTAQRRPPTDWRGIFDRRWPRLAIIIVAIGLLAALVVPLVGRPKVEPSPQTTPGPLVVPPQPTALRWTPDALREPYPVPLRAEPSGGAAVVDAVRPPSVPGGRQESAWVDPLDDGAPGNDPRVDLVNVEFFQALDAGCLHPNQLCLFYAPAQLLERPLPEPEDEWISYGIVVDRDGDGSPDGRVGLDNIPGGFLRVWYTDVFTPETKFVLGSGLTADGAYGESELPMSGSTTRPGRGYLWISPGLAGSIDLPHGHFYLWAALIRDGRLVSVDYAPNEGWLAAPDDDSPAATPPTATLPTASLPALRLPGTTAAPAGEYGWEGRALGLMGGMHRLVADGAGFRETALLFAVGKSCLAPLEEQQPVPVRVAGFDGVVVEPYEPPVVFGNVEDDITRAYALDVGGRTLCVYLTWHPNTTAEEIRSAERILDTLRAVPIGEDRIRITFTLEEGWDTG